MRPKLTEELIDQMAELKADGLTNRDICRAVGINEATLYRWLNKPSGKLHRALSEALKKGGERLQADAPHDHPRGRDEEERPVDGGGVASGAQVPRRVRSDNARPGREDGDRAPDRARRVRRGCQGRGRRRGRRRHGGRRRGWLAPPISASRASTTCSAT